MKTAAAYIRVSDERQDEFSPASQLKRIKEYCKNNNIELPEDLIFSDDGISAKSTKNRKSFNEMIALAKLKDRPFDVILVWKFSRFCRSQEQSIVYKSLLKKNGVEVISISEPLADNPFGGLIERIIEWMDEYYLIRLADEVRRGMTERATRGLPNVAPPFGYRMVDGKYVVHEEEAAVVREIFDLFNEGKSIRYITTYLVNAGIRRKSGKPIDNRGVEYILYNPCYIGYIRYNPNERSASERNFNNPDDIVIKSNHEPIVDEELFKEVQELLSIRKSIYHKYAHEEAPEEHLTMLKGLIRCHSCGSTLIYSPKNDGYQCHKYSKGVCETSHYISQKKINKMVIDELDKVYSKKDMVLEFKQERRVHIDYDKMISAQKLRLQRIKNAYQDGIDTLSEYRVNKQKVLDQIKQYEEEKARQAEREANDVEMQGTVANLIEILNNPYVPNEAKNKALKIVLEKVVLIKPGNKIELHYK